MILFLVILSTVCTVMLSGAQLAYDRAAAMFNVRLYGVILDLFEIEAPEDMIEQVFMENFDVTTVGNTIYYTSKSKEPGTVVFKAEGPGLWSRIEVLLAVTADGEKLYGMRVLSQAETPGLGGRISEIEFQESFRGVEIRPQLEIVKFASQPNEVDAITGASRTAQSLEKIINNGVAGMDKAF
jgi:Na+-transporting NADH:ubiquinone oxidoreductase subunit NqrC